MPFNPVVIVAKGEKPEWYASTAVHARADLRKSIWQLANTLVPYVLIFALMIVSVRQNQPYWLTLLLAVAASALYIRIFIFFHDCTHGSFLPTPRWNRNLGYLCGILTFTPFHDWRRSHAGHHLSAGDLDRRGVGDIALMTVAEYASASPLKRIGYRLYRNPLLMFGIGPIYYFLLRNRWPRKGSKRMDKLSVLYTNLAILGIMGAAGLTIGLKTYLLVQMPIALFSGPVGIWLFYVQHQFQGVYWARNAEWDPWRMAMEGASHYQLPRMLQWITGNIGYHHVHHMRPAIPNYNLQRCYEDTPQLQQTKPITLKASLDCLSLKLYDEEKRMMVGFKQSTPREEGKE
ncbi:fatty acid desaturase [Fundidesulfovibrio soli]|uniref:fatty acid desaturase n=1 Tax=Fundidesulfovibrio soli TaxID=2922716 RepID=UPI001FAF0802|nr:fatty acid desaturase [Fundidesulfovibrio soli]